MRNNKLLEKIKKAEPTNSFYFSFETKNGICIFKINNNIYKYKSKNSKIYTNEEFINILNASVGKNDYYELANPNSKTFLSQKRDLYDDLKFISKIKTILKYTKSFEKKNLINKILNNCLIIDREPILIDKFKKINFSNVKRCGQFHIDRDNLSDAYVDAINYAYHRYIDKFETQKFTKEEVCELELLSNNK